ncbi:MAG: hypothetical protein JJ896_15820 [Rhodothermales bacterium]|nr:hypothetical protein [Rhodothermales bacterium]MBO6781123.1 hypothetical protein [Rhodothermales bacterium]
MRLLTLSLLSLLLLPASAQEADLFSNLDFRNVGPTRGGRVTAVAGHRAHPHTFYMGATGGGVWKTTDYGTTWENISDGFFQTGSIGSIDVADADSDVIYVGTGSDGIRSNVIIGRGMYKSTDAGRTWTHAGLTDAGQLSAVVVHPTNPEVVYVAALGSPFGPNPERGVYKSIDGGSNWQHVLFVSENTGAVDLELNPSNPEEVYAAMWTARRYPWSIDSGSETENGIYKSTDGGLTWAQKSTGLPEGPIGKIDFAVTPADPTRVYALVEAAPEVEGLYRSNDRGETWRLISNENGIMRRPFYYTNVDADPHDADVVWVNNEGFFKSSNGGADWRRVSTPHGDNHDMWINPDNPDIFVQSNDGGANVTLDGGRTWSSQTNQPTAELYQINADDRFPYWIYAGQQDNSTIAVPSLPPGTRVGGHTAFWEAIGGCETGPAVPKPGDADIVYSNCKGRFGRFNRRTGQEMHYYVGAVDMYGVNPSTLPYRFQRVVPIEVSPHDANTVYHGSQYVHRTRDEGRTWEQISPDLTAFRPERQVISGKPITRDITGEEHYSTLYVIEESPLERGVIWTGANDGPVHVTRDDGASWTDVTPPMPPEGRIQHIDVSPHAPGKAYVAAYRYLLNDFRPYLFRTTDYGQSWTLLTDGTNGIGDFNPTRVVREDPDREGLLYAGTEYGLFVSFDDGISWQSMQANLPMTPITDIKVHRGDLLIATMGRSFWILDDLSPLHQVSEAIAARPAHLFAPREAYRMRYSAFQRESTDPEYLPAGATIWYHLAEDADVVELEILDGSGTVLRHYTSAEQAENQPAEQGMRAPVPIRPEPEALETTAGLHRFIWDLRHSGPLQVSGRTGRGPMAVPGEYIVRMSTGGESQTVGLTVLPDPRLEGDVSQADMEAQLAHNQSMGELLTRFARAVRAVNQQLEGMERTHPLRDRLAGLKDRMVTDNSDSYPPRMLDSHLRYLAGMTMRADQRPGRDAYERLATLTQEVDAMVAEVEQVLAELREDAVSSGG